MGRAQCLGQLGSVARERFIDAIKANLLPEDHFGHLLKAEQAYKEALALFPANAVRELETTHKQLGTIYGDAGQMDPALRHYRESIRYCEAMQDRFRAGLTRYNVAINLAGVERFLEARDWAQSALRDFKACENAEQEVVNTLKLLEMIESALRATSPPS